MIEFLRAVDSQLFLFLNNLHNSFFDFLMYWVSNRWIWIPFYLFLLYVIRTQYAHELFGSILAIALMVVISDQISSSIIKNLVLRLRPCHDPVLATQVHLVYGICGGKYGFVSSHATNCFALFTFLSFLFRKEQKWLVNILLGWALLVSYSRIYLGVHYPGDVIGGALLGSLIGHAGWYGYRFLKDKVLAK